MPQCVVIADDLTGANATGVLLKKMNYSGYDKLVNALNTAIQTLETAKNSGKSFVEEPGAQRVKNCIDAVLALDEELNNAGSWINLQDAI